MSDKPTQTAQETAARVDREQLARADREQADWHRACMATRVGSIAWHHGDDWRECTAPSCRQVRELLADA